MTSPLLALFLAAAVPTTPPPAVPATAPPPAVERISIGGTGIAVPVPAGYCPPQGNEVSVIAMVNAADTINDTPLALVSCRPGVGALDDYYLFKTTKTAVALELSRPVLLAGLGPAFKTLDTKALMDKAKSALKDGFGDSISVSDGTIAPAGQDDVCGYMAGILGVEANGQKGRIAIALCVTTIKRKLVTINHYEPASAKRSQAQMLADVRSFADRMIAANEK